MLNRTSAVAVRDAPAREIVRRQLDLHAVAGNQLDVVLAHLPRDVSEHDRSVVELDAEHRVLQGFAHETIDLDRLFLRRADPRLLLLPLRGSRCGSARAQLGTPGRGSAGGTRRLAHRPASSWFRHRAHSNHLMLARPTAWKRYSYIVLPPDVIARYEGSWPKETLPQRFESVLRTHGKRVGFIDGVLRITLEEIAERAYALAGPLAARDVRPGHVVSWQLPNWGEAAAVHIAALRIGAVSNPINPAFREHELRAVVAEARPRVLVVPNQWRGFD